MSYHLRFHEKINDDFATAAAYYAQISNDKLNDFKKQLLICYEKILTYPQNYFVLQKKHEVGDVS